MVSFEVRHVRFDAGRQTVMRRASASTAVLIEQSFISGGDTAGRYQVLHLKRRRRCQGPGKQLAQPEFYWHMKATCRFGKLRTPGECRRVKSSLWRILKTRYEKGSSSSHTGILRNNSEINLKFLHFAFCTVISPHSRDNVFHFLDLKKN